ncbi:hypothetical protein O1611_g8080 [Lasiodiplodia mahajangana]|uniref:Uncharacterized protein n=1 Tax=Lasiodiplodia mahajangana TaxID=1108764 RepID=A0ACC2JDQ6_9PEZI|nr:hypothetical protein O1611_g8080 [Lasiodiplodia mahajangana]
MALRTPPLLEPYLRLPHEASLILLTGVLGSSTNWLVHRYLYSLLASQSSSPHSLSRQNELSENIDVEPQQQHISVVFVSFLRDYAFWKDGSRRLGLDLDAATKKGSFVFVDGLTGLFAPSLDHGRRQPVIADNSGKRVLVTATTDHLRRTLEDAVAHLRVANSGTQTVLVIDQPDVLLATAGDTMSGQGLRDTILGLREGTSLEKEHASLALSLAHDAHLVMSLRMLETGTAKDVSGVLRVTPGGDEEITATSVEDRELLYFIRGDGSVRVFERGHRKEQMPVANPKPQPGNAREFPAKRTCTFMSLKGGFGVLLDTSLEVVLEAAGDILEVPHAASADGLSALGLLAPVVCNHQISSTHQVNAISRGEDGRRPSIRDRDRRTLSGLSRGVSA